MPERSIQNRALTHRSFSHFVTLQPLTLMGFVIMLGDGAWLLKSSPQDLLSYNFWVQTLFDIPELNA